MERRMRYIWWGILVILIIGAIWKLFLPHGSKAYIEKTVSSREIVVYITGAVEKPGLIKLTVDSRLDDALKQGHPLPEANLEGINPAERLKDGQKIVVPYKVQTQNDLTSQDPDKLTVKGTNQSNVTSSGLMFGSLSINNNSANGKININTAGATELDKLSGVGPALAERIIQYRTEHGPFAVPEDLQNVSGIGPKTYEKMSSQVTVQP
ncbi:MAG: helix-hairpin-helix domain-containing protein [Desulfitobacteriaceae bacterium]